MLHTLRKHVFQTWACGGHFVFNMFTSRSFQCSDKPHPATWCLENKVWDPRRDGFLYLDMVFWDPLSSSGSSIPMVAISRVGATWVPVSVKILIILIYDMPHHASSLSLLNFSLMVMANSVDLTGSKITWETSLWACLSKWRYLRWENLPNESGTGPRAGVLD